MEFDLKTYFPKAPAVFVDASLLWSGTLTGFAGHSHNGSIVARVQYDKPMYGTVHRGSHDLSDVFLRGRAGDRLVALAANAKLLAALYAEWFRSHAAGYAREVQLMDAAAKRYSLARAPLIRIA